MKKKFKLERYNQILWAGIGTGVVAVVVVVVLVATVAALHAMFKSGSGVPVAVVEENGQGGTVSEAVHYDFCQPIVVHGSPYQLIRVVTDRLVVRNKPAVLRKRGYDSFSSERPSYDSCGLYGSDRPSAVANVLVRNADSGAVQLLLKENAVIQALEYPRPPFRNPEPEFVPAFPPVGVLYWEIAFEDSNGDNVIDEHDDSGVYLSDIDGRNLVRVTPKVSRVLEKTYDEARKLLTLRIVRDSNSDGKLDDKDAPSLIEVSVVKRKMVREVLDRASLRELMRAAEPRRRTSPTPDR
jgi:hypothetical protein